MIDLLGSGGGGSVSGFSSFFGNPNTLGSNYNDNSNASCANLVIVTVIVNIDETKIHHLKIGSLLDIELNSDQNAISVHNDSDLIGFIVPPQILRLIDCMKNGTKYSAEIQKIDASYVEVKIFAI